MPFLILIALVALEVWVVTLVGRLFDSLGMALWLAIGTSFVGVALLRHAKDSTQPDVLMRRLQGGGDPRAFVMDTLGRVVGAVLLIVPGFVTDVCGVLFWIPKTRRYLGRALTWILAAVARRSTLSAPGLESIMGSLGGQGPENRPSRAAPRPGRKGNVRDADFRVLDDPS